jgi:hypothetical protein
VEIGKIDICGGKRTEVTLGLSEENSGIRCDQLANHPSLQCFFRADFAMLFWNKRRQVVIMAIQRKAPHCGGQGGLHQAEMRPETPGLNIFREKTYDDHPR